MAKKFASIILLIVFVSVYANQNADISENNTGTLDLSISEKITDGPFVFNYHPRHPLYKDAGSKVYIYLDGLDDNGCLTFSNKTNNTVMIYIANRLNEKIMFFISRPFPVTLGLTRIESEHFDIPITVPLSISLPFTPEGVLLSGIQLENTQAASEYGIYSMRVEVPDFPDSADTINYDGELETAEFDWDKGTVNKETMERVILTVYLTINYLHTDLKIKYAFLYRDIPVKFSDIAEEK